MHDGASVDRLRRSAGTFPRFRRAVASSIPSTPLKVLHRFEHACLADLQQRSNRWLAATALRHAVRSERAPARRPFPANLTLDLQRHPAGTIIFIRRTDDGGVASLLGHRFVVDSHW